MAIWLARHGETTLNASRVLQFADTPLSERGLEQAAQLAERLRALPIERVRSSDFARAMMTAEPAARALGLELELEPVLQERCFGELRGRAWAELSPDVFAPDFSPPGGESWDVFRARVARAWTSIVACAGGLAGDLLVVTHGLVCAVLVQDHLGQPDQPLGGFPNASLTRIEGPPWRASLVGCTAHLRG